MALWTERGIFAGMRLWVLCFLSVLSVALLDACKGRQAGSGGSRGTLVVTIEPLRWVTERVAGEAWRVVTVVPEGYNPEDYEPTGQTLVEIADAAAYLKVGELGFEQAQLPRLQETMPNLRVFDTSAGLRVDETGLPLLGFDPHTWTSPESMRKVATEVYNAMCEIDSVDSDIYRHNLQELMQEIDSVDGAVSGKLERLRHRTFVVGHPVLTYFAHEYGLRQLALENHGQGPSMGSMEQLIKACKADSVGVILIQSEFNTESAATLAREIGAEVKTFRPMSYEWKREMLWIANALADN